MEHNHPNYLLFLSAMAANTITMASNLPGWVKAIVAVLSVLLTVVSLINQATTLYKNAKDWQVVIFVRNCYFKYKNRNDASN